MKHIHRIIHNQWHKSRIPYMTTTYCSVLQIFIFTPISKISKQPSSPDNSKQSEGSIEWMGDTHSRAMTPKWSCFSLALWTTPKYVQLTFFIDCIGFLIRSIFSNLNQSISKSKCIILRLFPVGLRPSQPDKWILTEKCSFQVLQWFNLQNVSS